MATVREMSRKVRRKVLRSCYLIAKQPRPLTALVKGRLRHYFVILDTETWPLYTDAKLNLRDRVSGEVEKNSFVALPGKGEHSGLLPSKLCPYLGWDSVRSFIAMVQGVGLPRGPGYLQDLHSFNLDITWAQVAS